MWNKQSSKLCERTSERTCEWPSVNAPMTGSCKPTVQRKSFRSDPKESVAICLLSNSHFFFDGWRPLETPTDPTDVAVNKQNPKNEKSHRDNFSFLPLLFPVLCLRMCISLSFFHSFARFLSLSLCHSTSVSLRFFVFLSSPFCLSVYLPVCLYLSPLSR